MTAQKVSVYLGAGVIASRPASPDVPAGGSAFYYGTDTSLLYVYDGSSWHITSRHVIAIAAGDETSDLTTGASKAVFRMPYAMTLLDVRASVTTAPTGADLVVDINETGASVLDSNKLTVDAGEKTSTTASTPAVITDADLADDAEITVDIDQIGSTVAGTGLKVYLIGVPA